MKLTTLQKDLAPKLSVINRFISSRAQLPILSNVKLATDKNKLLLYATNLEMSVVARTGATVDEEGEITLPARALGELISNMDQGQIMIETTGENVKIVSEEFNSNLSGINASEFPSIPESLTKDILEIDTQVFSQALSKVLFSTASDDTRPALSGVLFIFTSNGLTLVSSDGFRLSKFDIKTPSGYKESKLIIPKHTIMEVSKLLDKDSKTLKFSFDADNNQIVFELSDIIISSRVIDAEYPDFQRIIPASHSTLVSVDKASFLKHIKSSSVFAKDGSGIVNISVEDGEVILTAESSKLGSHLSRMSANIEGDSVSISYNYRFIEEFLLNASGEDITIKFTNSSSAGVFLDKTLPSFLHLVMPVRG